MEFINNKDLLNEKEKEKLLNVPLYFLKLILEFLLYYENNNIIKLKIIK